MTETNLKKKVLKYLKETYPDAWAYKTCDQFTSGIPDIIICLEGKFIAIELKVGSNKATLLQAYTLEKIKVSGGACGVAYNLGEVKEILDNALSR